MLTGWITLITILLLSFYSHQTGFTYKYPQTLGLTLALPILNGIFLYGYTSELTGKKVLFKSNFLFHLIPFFLLLVLAVPFYILPSQEKIEVFKNQGKGFEWYSMIQLMSILVSGFSYSIASIIKIHKHRKNIQDRQSNIDKKMLKWLEYLSIGLALIWLLVLFFDDHIIYSGVVIFVFFIGFFGINQAPVFSYVEVESINLETKKTIELSNEPAEKIKYAKSRLEVNEVYEILERLEQLMITEKPFKNSELTLNDLSQKLNIHPNQLSQVINSKTGNTFYHYINVYRVKEFLRLSSLPENKKYTFLALAYDCGFNSKTTFNKYFKIYTGKTPSELIQS
ncbi:MAG: AraC family transcriptional regulator [Sporocytophaga sp.]|uniref:helix-turn-helix domain-containing protein n=1 Tax=Sporocytophaga sp. TaxID=2231183 RepID=UPI001B2DD177|nr:helix-turn-helix domain-containing protein [Sporocytophaga sp.]MBO9701802.1 AraC family transcriptional regulator [Sporocytophaga sp.]